MLKNIGGVAVGVLAGAIVIYIFEGLGHMIFPGPEGPDLKDPAALATHMDQIPLGVEIAVVIGWFAGTLAGGAAALVIARRWAPVAWIVAGTLFAMAAIAMIQIPHPIWIMIGAVIATALGGWGAVKLTGASYTPPAARP